MRVALQPAFVLHTRPYRDSSRLLEVFTAEHGRISLLARGARRPARGGSGSALLQPFTPLLLSFSGRGELKALGAIETAGGAIALRGERIYSGLYLNELLVRLLHRHDPHPQLFAAYGRALSELATGDAVEPALRRFEFTLLHELGYGFELATDGRSGESVREEDWYHYHPDCGLYAREGVMEAQRPAYAGSDLLAMAEGEFDGRVRLTARRLLRHALAAHLGETPLRSRELFRVRDADAGAAGEGTGGAG